MSYASRRLMVHGLIVIIIGLLLGFVLIISLVRGLDLRPLPINIGLELPGSSRGWRAAHTLALMNGTLAVAIAFAISRVEINERVAGWASFFIVFDMWANVIFSIFGHIAPNRGLSWGANAFGDASAIGMFAFVLASIGSVLAIVGFSMLLWSFLTARSEKRV